MYYGISIRIVLQPFYEGDIMHMIGDGTAQGNIEYLASLVEKGRSREGVVAPLKTAIRKVLQTTEGDKWRQTDVRSVDVADAMARFKNLTMGQYSQDSYRTYESRIARAVGWYKKFLENPGWYPPESQRDATAAKQPVDKGGLLETNPISASATPFVADSAKSTRLEAASHTDVISYPFPLSSGETAILHIPRAIAHADIKRMSAFLEALVVEEVNDG